MASPFVPATAEYVPRRPHETVLYRIVQEHLATFLEHTERTYSAPLPKYVVDTFEDYLVCGDFSQGFVRCHCDDCGHDVLVAFSCKHRGLCPSCGARRMCNAGANIVDRVLPNVPIRQWVLSLPFELRGLAAANPKVFGALDRIFGEELARMTTQLAGVAGAQTGGVAFAQVFGGSANLHPHLHVLEVDGVFKKVDGGVRFHEAPAPSKDDVTEVARRVRDRAVRWLHRHGFVDKRAAEDRGNEPAEPTALAGCQQLALAGGSFLARPFEPKQDPNADLDRKDRRFSATCDGFDVHCAVRIASEDDVGREKLVRYCARPPLSLDRIEVLRDGRISYRMKTPRKGRTHRVMEPLEFMARLAALIPHPWIPQIRYHGVFASRSSWRPLVTPKPPPQAAPPKSCAAVTTAPQTTSPAAPPPVPVSPLLMPPPAEPAAFEPWVFQGSGVATPSSHPWMFRHRPAEPAEPVMTVEPTTISITHWGRLNDGELFAKSRYVDWATLMKRTWDLDVMKCPKCDHKLRVLATITDPAVVRQILDHLHVRSTPLPRGPAREPTWEQAELGFEAA